MNHKWFFKPETQAKIFEIESGPLVPNMRKANCAKAMKTMPNIIEKAATSEAL